MQCLINLKFIYNKQNVSLRLEKTEKTSNSKINLIYSIESTGRQQSREFSVSSSQTWTDLLKYHLGLQGLERENFFFFIVVNVVTDPIYVEPGGLNLSFRIGGYEKFITGVQHHLLAIFWRTGYPRYDFWVAVGSTLICDSTTQNPIENTCLVEILVQYWPNNVLASETIQWILLEST